MAQSHERNAALFGSRVVVASLAERLLFIKKAI
jgi:hypothetical protein